MNTAPIEFERDSAESKLVNLYKEITVTLSKQKIVLNNILKFSFYLTKKETFHPNCKAQLVNAI
jgi:Zn finger protein HypA/HybF involved in hydrogenase expression